MHGQDLELGIPFQLRVFELIDRDWALEHTLMLAIQGRAVHATGACQTSVKTSTHEEVSARSDNEPTQAARVRMKLVRNPFIVPPPVN